MTTRISKILVLFITVASVGFMAVIVANVLVGGPNWKAAANELKEVAFDQANPQAPWTSKRRTNQDDMGGCPILPAAVTAVQKKLIQEQEEEGRKLDEQITAFKSLIETNTALNAADTEAIRQRQAALAELYTQKEAAWKKVASDITMKTEELTKITGLTNVRNEESIRYRHQIEELVIEKQQIEEEVRRLKDLLYQANANWERAKTRQSVLVEDGATIKPNEEPSSKDVSKPDDSKPAAEEPAVEKSDAPKAENSKEDSSN